MNIQRNENILNRDKNIFQQKIRYYVIFILLFLFFIQFMSFRKDIFFIVSVLGSGIICLAYAVKQKKIEIYVPEIILTLTFFFYTYISKKSISNVFIYTLLPALFLLVGKCISKDLFLKDSNQDKIFLLAGVFVLSYMIHGVLNCFIYFYIGVIPQISRNWIDIWGEALPATQHSIYTLPTLAIMFPAFIYWKRYKIFSGGIIFVGIFFLFHSIHSLSRIPVMICGIVACWEWLLFLLLNKKELKVQWKKRAIFFIITVCFFGGMFFLTRPDILNDLKIIQVLKRNGGIFHNVRFQAQLKALQQLFVYPWGGKQMDLAGLNYAHNVWLDMANTAGVIPFFLMVFYTLISFIDMIKFLVDASVKPELKYVISGLHFALFLYYMVEPALQANLAYLIPWFYLHGIVIGCREKNKDENKKSFS